MRVLLVKPCWPYPLDKNDSTYNRIWPPLCLLTCAALLENAGIEVKILDTHQQRILPEDLPLGNGDYDKIFVTSSPLDRWQCPNINIAPFVELINTLKKQTSEVYALGYHGTIHPEEIIKLTGVKAVIRGEPEGAVVDICLGRDLSQIKGVSYFAINKYFHNPKGRLIDLDELSPPAFHLLNRNNYYYEILGNNLALFEASRGCVYKCVFCDKTMFGETYRTKSIDKLLREIDLAVNKFGITSGYFIDANFTANKILVEQVCEYLIKADYNFKWCCQTRIDLVDQDLLVKMKKAGCALIHYGIETGSPEMLRNVNKDINLEKAVENIEITRRTGIKTLVFFIFGLPNETAGDLEQTLSFARRLDTDYVSFHFYYNYLTEVFDRGGKRGPVFRNDLKKIMKKEYLRFYLTPKRLLNELFNTNICLAPGKLLLFYRYLKKLHE